MGTTRMAKEEKGGGGGMEGEEKRRIYMRLQIYRIYKEDTGRGKERNGTKSILPLINKRRTK